MSILKNKKQKSINFRFEKYQNILFNKIWNGFFKLNVRILLLSFF